ncbi:MAG: PadR family transcriptional regulator [Actinobacteria bacterium]|nr:PadR family transcriptional regulator [Actinomycetota bacterium]
MSLRNAVLGLLAERPMSGYDLTRHFDESVAGAWSASHSQIYPELARLQEEGLIRKTADGPRGRKVYSLTEEGLAEVRQWLVATEPDRNSRSEAYMRVFFLWLVEPTDAYEYLRRQAEFHEANLAHLEAQAADLDEEDSGEAPLWAPARWSRITVEAGIRHERTLLEWALWAMEEVRHEVARGRRGAVRGAATVEPPHLAPPEVRVRRPRRNRA